MGTSSIFKISIREKQKRPLQLLSKVLLMVAPSVLLNTMSSDAGVVLYDKPQLKNYVEEVPAVVSTPKSSSKDRLKTTDGSAKVKSQDSTGSVEIAPQVIVLPGTVVGLTGIAFLA